MKKTVLKTLAAFCAVFLFAPGALAEEQKFYAGASIGQSKIKDACDTVSESEAADLGVTDVSGDGGDCEDTDLGWKIYGGMSLSDYFGAELGYAQLGEALVEGANLTVTTGGGNVVLNGDFGYEHDGSFFIVALGKYPATENISIFAKGGFHFWEVSGINKGTLTVDGSPARITGDDDTDLLYGVGAQFVFDGGLGFRAEWERFEFDGDLYEDKVDLFSAGVVYAF
jgi:OOP family OmpA-OmpF porin